jgi:glutathione synthase/RimK-type ligase-like ATP-grasp enzyme
MTFGGIISMHGMIKNMEHEIKWKQRRENTKNEHKNQNILDDVMSEKQRMVADLQRMNEEQERGMRITVIESRMLSGRRLSLRELNYLKEHAPELHSKAVKIERERREYEAELKWARSKEDVARIHGRRTMMFSAEAKHVMSSNKPKSEKLESLRFIHMRVNATVNTYNGFVETRNYAKLPDKDVNSRRRRRVVPSFGMLLKDSE